MPEPTILIALFFAGIAAGISNAIAGGGTFFTFPLFMATGIPPIVANASNAIAVWPGHAMAVIGYRKELKKLRGQLGFSVLLVFVGGAIGAWLLTVIANSSFTRLIPFLILFATLLFAFGKQAVSVLQHRLASGARSHPVARRLSEFAFAVYGGFFAAGYGVMLMAWLQMTNDNDIQTNNALKNLIATIVSSTAVVVFIFSGIVSWSHTGAAFIGAVIGGLVGARAARALSALWLHRTVVAFGLFLSGYYAIKYYG